MQHNLLSSFRWVQNGPNFNAKACLSLRSVMHFPSGRSVRGSELRYRIAYDDFITRLSETMLGGCHAYGLPIFVPNRYRLNICPEGGSNIVAELALPDTVPLCSQIERALDIWGRSHWSGPNSWIKAGADSYGLLDAARAEA